MVLSLNPYENKNMKMLYCPDCGRKLASYDVTEKEPRNVYPYCPSCKKNQKPTKIRQVRFRANEP